MLPWVIGLAVGLGVLLVGTSGGVGIWLTAHKRGEPEPPLWTAETVSSLPTPVPGSRVLGERSWPRWTAYDEQHPALDASATLADRLLTLEGAGLALGLEEPARCEDVARATRVLEECALQRCGLIVDDNVLPSLAGVRLLLGSVVFAVARGRWERATPPLLQVLERLAEGTQGASTLLTLMARASALEEAMAVAELAAHSGLPAPWARRLELTVTGIRVDAAGSLRGVLQREWVSLYRAVTSNIEDEPLVDWAWTSRRLNADAARSLAYLDGRGEGVGDADAALRSSSMWWAYNRDGRVLVTAFASILTSFERRLAPLQRNADNIGAMRASILRAQVDAP
ncbi:MAG: hypothetical protein AB8I08_06435 [Sandaracinaceae bacterium]